MQCPKCKKILDDGIRFCPDDGTPLIETGITQADSTPTGGKRPPSRELQLPVVIGARYRLEELRGGGGMAKVYKAIDVTLDREVAVKLINPDLRSEEEFDERFEREARIASKLADPHIVVVHDFGLDATHGPYLVMEFLQGQSLRERLVASGPLPMKACLQLAGQLFLALVHAHGKGIVHRDIKPDNIFLLNQSGVRLHVRVLDFGIARIYAGDPGQSKTITHAGAVLGTPRYMSPEQLAGQQVDARSDLYSAALVIWEALTGQLPYLHGKKLTDQCPDATPALQALLEQCLKPAADERPPTAVEVYLRLQELGKASGILLLPPGAMDKLVAARKSTTTEPTVAFTPKEEDKRRSRRRLLIGLGAAVVLVAAIGLGKVILFPGGDKDDPGGPCRLHDVKFGDDWEEARQKLAKLGGLNVDRVNPFADRRTKELLGHVLEPEDVGPKDMNFNELRTGRTADDKVVVIFHNDKVAAVVSTDRTARSARNIQIGDTVNRMLSAYVNQSPDAHPDVPLPGGGVVKVYRYSALGIGFEARDNKIVSMTLFRPR